MCSFVFFIYYWVDSFSFFGAGLQDRRVKENIGVVGGESVERKAQPFDDIEIHNQGKTFNWKDQRDLRWGKSRQQRGTKKRLHTSTRVDAVVMKRPHTREKRKREKRWISISYFLYTCDNPLMPNRCLLNVSGLISNSWWTGLGWTGVIGPSSSSVSYSSFALRQSSTFFSDLLKRATWATGRPASARQQSAECCRRSHASPPLLSITDVYKSHRYPFHSFILSPSFFMQL